MADDGFPALPQGFAPDDTAASDDGFPALPKSFKVESKFKKAETPEQYERELRQLIKDDAPKEDIEEYAAVNGQKITNIDTVVSARDKGMGVGTVVGEDGTAAKFAKGFVRAPGKLAEGVAQVGIRAAEKVGAISDETSRESQRKLGEFGDKVDKELIQGDAGEAGALTGELMYTAGLPLGAVDKFGKVGNIAATAGKRAVVGGAATGLSGAEKTAEEQDAKAATGAIVTPLAVPVVQKIVGALGAGLAKTYIAVAGGGVGKKIYDASGVLTSYGRVLRARLRSVNRDLPDEFIDDTLAEIVKANPRRLPADKDVVPEYIAKKEGVPLTGAMKTRDATGIQQFEAQQTVDGPGKQAAIDLSRDIDTKIIDNVKGIGSGRSSGEAATDIGKATAKAYDKDRAAVDGMYEPLKRIVIKAPRAIGDIGHEIRTTFGKGGFATAGSKARGYMERIQQIAEEEKPLFGDVWKLSKDINEDLRRAVGSDRYELGVVKKAVDNYFKAAEGGGAVDAMAAKQLRDANKAYRAFSRKFGENPVKLGAGRTNIPDDAGKAVQNIIGHVKDAGERGDQIDAGKIETLIFGSAKSLDSASGKKAVAVLTRLSKADPAIREAAKDITVNRIVSQIEAGLTEKSLKPEAMQTAVKAAVEGNRAVLTAAGFSAKDITRLQQNAYLAALKIPPVGARARGSSATNKAMLAKGAKIAFRRALSAALGYGASGPLTPIGGVITFGAAEGGFAAADAIAARRLAAKTLSGKVAAKADIEPTSKAGKTAVKAGKRISRAAGYVAGKKMTGN